VEIRKSIALCTIKSNIFNHLYDVLLFPFMIDFLSPVTPLALRVNQSIQCTADLEESFRQFIITVMALKYVYMNLVSTGLDALSC